MVGEADAQLLDRIILDPVVMCGKSVIRGTRLTVEFILSLLAHGASVSEVTEEFEGITEQDIRACLLFSSLSLRDRVFFPQEGASSKHIAWWNSLPEYASLDSSEG